MRALLPVVALVPLTFGSIVIDHTCTSIENIPGVWIDLVQSDIDSHYAHTSHGSQLTWGLSFVLQEDPEYAYLVGSSYLPSSSSAYCVFDGQENGTYITPELYWESDAGIQLTRNVLNNNPSISTSMWGWCSQCDYYSQAQIENYLNVMSQLESEFPDVTFVYFTGNAQAEGASGNARHQRNQQIRTFCLNNDKVLFDFADLDCWWFNPNTQAWEQNTYSYGGSQIPSEHPQFEDDEYGHTTAESCEQKGRAWWYMMALLAGWSGTGIGEASQETADHRVGVFPNPAHGTAHVSVDLASPSTVRISVVDLAGRSVYGPVNVFLQQGANSIPVPVETGGVYVAVVETGAVRCFARFVGLTR